MSSRAEVRIRIRRKLLNDHFRSEASLSAAKIHIFHVESRPATKIPTSQIPSCVRCLALRSSGVNDMMRNDMSFGMEETDEDQSLHESLSQVRVAEEEGAGAMFSCLHDAASSGPGSHCTATTFFCPRLVHCQRSSRRAHQVDEKHREAKLHMQLVGGGDKGHQGRSNENVDKSKASSSFGHNFAGRRGKKVGSPKFPTVNNAPVKKSHDHKLLRWDQFMSPPTGCAKNKGFKYKSTNCS